MNYVTFILLCVYSFCGSSLYFSTQKCAIATGVFIDLVVGYFPMLMFWHFGNFSGQAP